MQIRDMLPSDFPQVMELEKKQYKPWPQYAFGQAIRLGHRVVVVESDSKILGYAVWDKGHGRTICAINSKAAIMLYKDWFDDTSNKKVSVLWVETHRDSVEAIAMLLRFGFTKQGTRPSFYGPGEDATVWAKPNLTEALIGVQGRSPLQVIEPV